MQLAEVTPEQSLIAGRDEAWYQCGCGAERFWGNIKPATDYAPLLRCEVCRKNTRHRYVSMSEGQWLDYSARVGRQA